MSTPIVSKGVIVLCSRDDDDDDDDDDNVYNLYKVDTILGRQVKLVPRVSCLDRGHCIFPYKNVHFFDITMDKKSIPNAKHNKLHQKLHLIHHTKTA